MNNSINILLCFDDKDGNYTRHAAVTILSLLETNKDNNIKIWIMSSYLSKENVDELKRIVNLYNQEIEFIIREDIVPEELKKVIINKNNLTWGTWYRWFFSKFIKGIDRILYMDCDVLVMKDVSTIYNMDMHGKAIAGWYVTYPYCYKNLIYGINQYFNSGVLLFDANKYNSDIITVKKMKEINKNFSKYYMGGDEEKMNIICKDDIYITNQSMNYQIISRRFNKGLNDAKIVHCLQKPYKQYDSIPKELIDVYNHYLDNTKWKGFPKEKAKYGYMKYLYKCVKEFCYIVFINIISGNFEKKYALWKFSKLYK